MEKSGNTFYLAFEEDTAATPPLKLVVYNQLTTPVVREGMSAANFQDYTQPNLGQPGQDQTTNGKDLGKVATALYQHLEGQKLNGCSLMPKEDGYVSVTLGEGRKAEVPASWEVISFIAKTLEKLRRAGKTA